MKANLQNKIDLVKHRYEGWVLGSIKVTYEATKGGAEESTPLAAFILTSCAIDFLAGFWSGITSFKAGSSRKNYKAFVNQYLSQYDAEDVYTHIRCRLAHNYSIGGKMELTHQEPDRHDPRDKKRVGKVVNFENFFDDFKTAAAAYFKDLKIDSQLQTNFERRYKLGLVRPQPPPKKAV